MPVAETMNIFHAEGTVHLKTEMHERASSVAGTCKQVSLTGAWGGILPVTQVRPRDLGCYLEGSGATEIL